jgi:hypothetical protein
VTFTAREQVRFDPYLHVASFLEEPWVTNPAVVGFDLASVIGERTQITPALPSAVAHYARGVGPSFSLFVIIAFSADPVPLQVQLYSALPSSFPFAFGPVGVPFATFAVAPQGPSVNTDPVFEGRAPGLTIQAVIQPYDDANLGTVDRLEAVLVVRSN